MGTIGERLEQLRALGGLNKVQMAAVGKTSKQRYGRIVNGQIEQPAPDSLIPWAHHFGVRLEWIVTGKPPKEAPAVAQSQPVGLDLDRIGLALTAIDKALSDMVIQGVLGTLAEPLEFAYRRALRIEDHTSPKEREKLDSEVRKSLRGWVDGRGRTFEAGAGEGRAATPKAAKTRRGKG